MYRHMYGYTPRPSIFGQHEQHLDMAIEDNKVEDVNIIVDGIIDQCEDKDKDVLFEKLFEKAIRSYKPIVYLNLFIKLYIKNVGVFFTGSKPKKFLQDLYKFVSQKNETNLIQVFLEVGFNPYIAMRNACENENEQIIRYLISKGVRLPDNIPYCKKIKSELNAKDMMMRRVEKLYDPSTVPGARIAFRNMQNVYNLTKGDWEGLVKIIPRLRGQNDLYDSLPEK